MKTEAEVNTMLEKALADNDEKVIAEFRRFGDTKRQQIMNYRHYHQWLSCGYEGEPTFNEYGWCNNCIPDDAIEYIPLWSNDCINNEIEVAQLPNGKWVCGYNYMLSDSGGVAGCSIWHTQFASRLEAVRHVANRIKAQIKNGTAADKKHIADVDRAVLNTMQLSLF